MSVTLNRIKNIFNPRVITLEYTLHYSVFCLQQQDIHESNQPM